MQAVRFRLVLFGVLAVSAALGGCRSQASPSAGPSAGQNPALNAAATAPPQAAAPDPAAAAPIGEHDVAAASPEQGDAHHGNGRVDASLNGAAAFSAAPLLLAVVDAPDTAPTVDEASGLRLISARLEEGITRVVVSWPPLDPTRYSAWELETAPVATGPFLPRSKGAAARGDKPGTASVALAQPIAWFRLIRVTRAGRREASGVIRALAIKGGDYDLGRRTVPYAPDHLARVKALYRFPASLAELKASVPLAVITHGNTGVCRNPDGEDVCDMSLVINDACPEGKSPTPSAEGFIWLAENLASRGYVVVVVDANTVNCTALPMIVQGRTSLILEHLRLWARATRGMESTLGDGFRGRIDFTRLALVGHSNGAEASAMIPAMLGAPHTQPQLFGARVASVVAIAGSDSLGAVPSSTPFLAIQAGCDMQLPAHDGLRLYDRSVATRTAPHTVAYVVAATHNGFNQRWLRDESMDGPSGTHHSACAQADKLATWRQRALLDATVGDWLLSTARVPERGLPAWLRGDAPMPAAIVAAVGGPIDVRWSHGSGEKLIIESFDGDEAPFKNDLGGLNSAFGFGNGGRCYAIRCDEEFAHASWGGRFEWDRPGARFHMDLPEIDATKWTKITLRITQLPTSSLNRAGRTIDATLRIFDAEGNAAGVPLSSVGGVEFPSMLAQSSETSRFFHAVWADTRMPLERFAAANPKLQMQRIVGIELAFDRPGSEHGAIVLGNIELTRP